MHAIRVHQKAAGPDQLGLTIEDLAPVVPAGSCLVEVASAGINPSDVKAVLGLMPQAVWPRVPGRDYAGIVREGPPHLVGKEVWGSGGELGIQRDGTHARFLVMDAAHVREKPSNVSLREAGAAGVPFITAYEGFKEAGGVKSSDVVLVLGANGKVGQAAIQLATMAGATVVGVEPTAEAYVGHANGEVDLIGASTTDLADYVRDMTNGHGADIIYNMVGSPYFEQANRAMAVKGRQIFISTIDHTVTFDIFAFYRGAHKYVGINTLDLDSGDCAEILDALKPGFESGRLKPFPVPAGSAFPLDRADEAYRAVLGGTRDRIVLTPNG